MDKKWIWKWIWIEKLDNKMDLRINTKNEWAKKMNEWA